MHVMLDENAIGRLFRGETVQLIYDAGETKVEIAMSDIGFLRLHGLVHEAAQDVARRTEAPWPNQTPTPSPAWGGNQG